MKRTTSFIAAAAAAVSLFVVAARADTISDSVVQSDFNNAIGSGQSAPIGSGAFDFSGQTALATIDSISITLTIIDGDTGLGPNNSVDTPYPPDGNPHGDDDFDVNSLSLMLDGVDLGQNLLLNGFNSYDNSAPLAAGDYVTLTLTGTPTLAQANAILTALGDGMLSASILDSTGVASSNGFRIPNTAFGGGSSVNATLSLTGTAVPEPGSIALLAAGALLVPLMLRRRRQ